MGRRASGTPGSRPRQTGPVSVSYPTDPGSGRTELPTKLIPKDESSPSLPMFRVTPTGVVRRRAGLRPSRSDPRGDSRRRAFATGGAVLLVALLIGSALGAVALGDGASAHETAGAAPSSRAASVAADAGASAAPRAPTANPSPGVASPPCYSLNATVCISMVNTSEPNIVPGAGSHVSATEPSSNTTLALYVKSEYSLTWSTAHSNGPLAPIQLNASGVLWNGDDFYTSSDGTIWHPTGTDWWTPGPTGVNVSYPYWYGVNFSAKGPTGVANFYPGMTLTWWVYFVENTSGTFSHWSSVNFTFTFSGAWPYSPDVGSPQYAGAGAAAQDLSVVQNPLVPNYNDSVNVTIATTSADLASGASLGGGYLDVTETAPDGALLDRSTVSFAVTVHGGSGSVQSSADLPPSLAHFPGALVQYRITAWDTNTYGPDQVETQSYNYTVNGNGTFSSLIFADDLSLSTSPVGPGIGSVPPPTVAAGQAVQLLLASRNLGTAIFAAEVVYTFSYTAINETFTGTQAFARLNSTHFAAALPEMPLGAAVSFQVYAWDFSQDRDVSSPYAYATPTLASLAPSVPTNSTFFLVYVYDNGTHEWVTGADVQVQSASGYVHTYATTFGGVAYPNATGEAFVPLLLPAGETYEITVTDPSYAPTAATYSTSATVTINVPHNLTQQGVLKVGPGYVVAEAGSAVYFWLNQSAAGVAYAAPVGTSSGTLLAAAVGLGAAALAVVPLLGWWARIRARRVAQEKRITL